VQPVRKLHHNDANVVEHGRSILRTFLSLPRLGSQQIRRLIFVTPSPARDVLSPNRSTIRAEEMRVSSTTSCEGGAKRRNIQLHVRQDVRHFEGMREVRISGLAQFARVLFGGEFEDRRSSSISPAGRVCRTFSTSSRKRDCSARVVRSVLPLTSEARPVGFSTDDIDVYLKSI